MLQILYVILIKAVTVTLDGTNITTANTTVGSSAKYVYKQFHLVNGENIYQLFYSQNSPGSPGSLGALV